MNVAGGSNNGSNAMGGKSKNTGQCPRAQSSMTMTVAMQSNSLGKICCE